MVEGLSEAECLALAARVTARGSHLMLASASAEGQQIAIDLLDAAGSSRHLRVSRRAWTAAVAAVK
jgi:hypothetical protein